MTSIYAIDEDETVSFLVDGRSYSTFIDALKAASEDDSEDNRFRLVHDIEGSVSNAEGFLGYTINENESFYLDLNGQSIIIEDKVPNDKDFILFQNNGEITIDDKSSEGDGVLKVVNTKELHDSYAHATVIIRSSKWASSEATQIKTTVNIKGGFITMESEDHNGLANLCYAIDAMDSATVNLSGGTLQGDYYAVRLYIQTGYGNAALNMTGGTIKEGEGRRTPLIHAQYGGHGSNPSKEHEININILGGKLYCPNEAMVYYGWNYAIPLNIKLSNCEIQSPGIIDDHFYQIIEDDNWFKLVGIDIRDDVVVDKDYIRRDLNIDDLIDPKRGAIELNNQSGIEILLGTSVYQDYPTYYYDDLLFVLANDDNNNVSPPDANDHDDKDPSNPASSCDSNDKNCDDEISCSERFGGEWYWNEQEQACMLKQYSIVIVDTSVK